MTHDELVCRAVRWLRRSRGCSTVVWSQMNLHWESPDAIGWNSTGRSTVVECKASRGDFLRDRGKPHRRGPGLGFERYFMTPPGLVRGDELPEGWGLLECLPAVVRVRAKASPKPHRDWSGELIYALAAARRNLGPAPTPFLDGVLPDVGL